MKPIKLTIAGLQSYREEQTVDFETLCEGGVFGIFGPTGSGKSSILDAMTLALYGKVERASGGTQGIMNQAERTLSVTFTFELAGAEGTARYRVERGFKRTGDVSVTCHLCRFVEAAPSGDIVLADKLADVNRCVEARIGLTMADFTRAVVLPQGKFAEFLSLTGKDRRQMLQRLFALERFGDGLALRLNQRAKAAEAALSETAAEQLGLGDASEAAVAAAAAARAETAAAAQAAREALAAAEAAHAALHQVRERQEELRAKEAQQAALAADQPRIARLEAELGRLAAAERLLPALEAADAADRELREAAARERAAEQAHAARRESAEAASAAWAEAQAAAAEAEPRLAQRREQLAQAERLEREAAQLAADAAEAERQLRAAEARQLEFEAQAEKAKQLLEKAALRQQELRAQLKAVELTEGERTSWMAAARMAELLQGSAARLAEAERELAAAEAAVGRSAETMLAAVQRRAGLAAEAGGQLAAAAESLAGLREREAELRAAADRLPAQVDALRVREREATRHALAAQLASSLEAGAPCPVCGSCEHPNPNLYHPDGAAATNSAAADETEAAIRTGERLRSELGSLLLRLSSARQIGERTAAQLAAALDQESPTASADPAQREAAAGSAVQDRPPAASPSIADPVEAIAQLAAAVPELARFCIAEEQAQQTAAARADRLVRELSETDRRLSAASAEREALEAALHTARTKRGEAAEAHAAAGEQWRKQFALLSPEDAPEAIAAWERRDREAQAAREGLDKSVAFVDAKQSEAAEAQRGAQEAKLTREVLRERLDGQRKVLEEQRVRLQEWTNGRPAAEWIAETEREASALRERLTTARERHEREAKRLQEASEQRVSASELAKTAALRQRETAGKLASLLTPETFLELSELREAVVRLPDKAALAAEIEQYREAAQQLAAQIAHLRDKLEGRTVDDAEWQAGLAALQTAKTGSEAALQAAAKAERDAEELERKHVRWSELERRRLELQELSGRLSKLQTVFRGNAFVEYVAEEQLVQVCRDASERLGFLTKRRYALEVDSGGGFVIRDDANGGIRRPVGTLSGGETFLASLALALALSGQIQLRGQYPLQFFFLDEGFGTLDPELLETVITSLERLHTDELAVGVISHVPELRARLPRRLVVTPAEPSGSGSRVSLETL